MLPHGPQPHPAQSNEDTSCCSASIHWHGTSSTLLVSDACVVASVVSMTPEVRVSPVVPTVPPDAPPVLVPEATSESAESPGLVVELVVVLDVGESTSVVPVVARVKEDDVNVLASELEAVVSAGIFSVQEQRTSERAQEKKVRACENTRKR